MSDEVRIKVIENGPLRVTGAPLGRRGVKYDEHERPVDWVDRGRVQAAEAYSLCRCGASANKPFCDGSHKQIDWEPEETADRAPSATRLKHYEGDGVAMSDDQSLCVHVGFCVQEHTMAWTLVKKAQSAEQREELARMVHACPSGRLQYYEPADGPAVEPDLPERIDIVDDGPLFVQGGIPVQAADGESYERRNRVTLCRCGASKNKPFCDSAHKEAGFRDA